MQCSPDNARRSPAAFVRNGKTSAGGTGRPPAAPPAAPAWKVPKRVPSTHGVPSTRGGLQNPWGPPLAMGHMGTWMPQCHRGGRSGHRAPSLPARKRPPRTHGDIAGPGTPSLRTGLGTPKIWWLPSGTEHLPSRQLLLLMLIRASPAGGGSGVKSVLKGAFVSRSRAAGLGCSEHPSFAFPSFFLCLPGAERRRCGGCQALGAPAFVPGRC